MEYFIINDLNMLMVTIIVLVLTFGTIITLIKLNNVANLMKKREDLLAKVEQKRSNQSVSPE